MTGSKSIGRVGKKTRQSVVFNLSAVDGAYKRLNGDHSLVLLDTPFLFFFLDEVALL